MSQPLEAIEGRIKEIIIASLFLDIDTDGLDATESLTETYGVDSVRLFDMIVGMEEAFQISFEDEELLLENFDTVRAITDRVRDKLPDA